jgi:hypothetical protein
MQRQEDGRMQLGQSWRGIIGTAGGLATDRRQSCCCGENARGGDWLRNADAEAGLIGSWMLTTPRHRASTGAGEVVLLVCLCRLRVERHRGSGCQDSTRLPTVRLSVLPPRVFWWQGGEQQ